MPHDLSSFEINPLVFAGGLPMALDVAARAGPATDAEWAAPRPADRIDALLHPGTIAVMGVSERMNPGRVILRNILGAGFPPERITVIKPAAAEIDGCRAVPDLASLPEPVDLLLLAIAAESVPSVVDDAISARAATAIVLISGGLGERAGTEDLAQRVRRAVAVSRTGDWGGPVINGGNSMGLRSGPGGFDATFIPPERMTPGPAAEAPLAVVAQSGAFTLSRLDRLPWLRPRYLVSVGNQIDLTVGDYLAHFAADPTVEIVACYVEGFALLDGERWLEAAAAIRQRGGAVLLMRGGRTAAGARSAASHTAAVASDDTVARSLAASAGVVEAETLDEFEDLLRLAVLLRGKQIGGLAVGAVSNAGFECVAMADAVGPLHMARFAPATVARLQRLLDAAGLDAIVGPQNPLDLTPVAGDGVFAAAVEAVLDDEGVDLGIIGCVPYTPALRTLPARIAEPGSLPKLLAALAGHPTPWVAVVDGGARYDPMVAFLEESGVPVLRTADRALRLLGRYATRRSR